MVVAAGGVTMGYFFEIFFGSTKVCICWDLNFPQDFSLAYPPSIHRKQHQHSYLQAFYFTRTIIQNLNKPWHTLYITLIISKIT